jgi:acetyl esterase/lipase
MFAEGIQDHIDRVRRLFEESAEYAAKLRAANVATELRDAAKMIHGFLRPIETSPPRHAGAGTHGRGYSGSSDLTTS